MFMSFAAVLKKPSVIPGFGVTLGFTLFYLALVVLIPLSGLFVKTATVSLAEFWQTISAELLRPMSLPMFSLLASSPRPWP